MLQWMGWKRRLRIRGWTAIVIVFGLSIYFLARLGGNDILLCGWRLDSAAALPYLDLDWTSQGNDEHPAHPIDGLIANAFRLHQARLAKRTFTVHDGAAAYRRRHGRHPPPGFDLWYSRAFRANAIIVEDFFDQIYEDLEPFWGVEPEKLRAALIDWPFTLGVRNGKVLDVPHGFHRSRTWGDGMHSQLAKGLPDLDFAINPFDEPRVVVPADVVDTAMAKALTQKERMIAQQIPASRVSG